MIMDHRQDSLKGSGGTCLFYQAWLPDGEPKGVLAVVHGLAEHSDRYNNLVQPLLAESYAVYAYDLRGHGRSEGRRGHVNQWQEYREDTSAILSLIRESHQGKPLFLFGHSFGTLIVLDHVVQNQEGLHGLIVSSAAIEPSGVASPAKIMMARLMSRMWPTLPVSIGDLSKSISTDPAVRQAYREDPLIFTSATVRWGNESLKIIEMLKESAEKIRLPVLFIHGGDDPLNTLEGARKFFERLGSVRKQMIVYPGSMHETLNDKDHNQAAQDIIAWMDSILA
jgi:alpha-beta hydrolase superfamily lysophospholipase